MMLRCRVCGKDNRPDRKQMRPKCAGCGVELREDNTKLVDQSRDYEPVDPLESF